MNTREVIGNLKELDLAEIKARIHELEAELRVLRTLAKSVQIQQQGYGAIRNASKFKADREAREAEIRKTQEIPLRVRVLRYLKAAGPARPATISEVCLCSLGQLDALIASDTWFVRNGLLVELTSTGQRADV